MPTVTLDGDLELDYSDQGDGPAIVLQHGPMMDGSVFDQVAADLARDHRVLVPELPLGSHRRPVPDGVDLSPIGLSRLIRQFLAALDLQQITLVSNDWAGALFLLSDAPEPRIDRLVIATTEAYENYPPGRGGKLLAKITSPITLALILAPMRIPALRRSGRMHAEMVRHPIPARLIDRWLEPLLTDPAIRRDLVRMVRQMDPAALAKATPTLRTIKQPTLVLWTTDSVMMPAEHGPRLARDIPDATLVTFDDCGTLMSLDQPERFIRAIREFTGE
jgi:pimeloyl-ACP methyl ester carboxylesterase